jgi:hypothetical protein
MPDVIQFQDTLGTLRLGGGLSTTQVDALNAGKDRAIQQLDLAATLEVTGDTLKVTNLTGHKLISGYPEGRRMWLNIKWYDDAGNIVVEDGAYGDLTVDIDGTPTIVRTLLDLDYPYIYEAHYGMTQEWATALIDLGYAGTTPLSFDRGTGAVTLNLGDFVLNNSVIKDNRIPPYGFAYDEARVRNALPVPANQYGGGTDGSTYNYWDEITLSPPGGATYAEINLMYQPTSWEYVQFLYLANNGQNAFLGQEGQNLLDAWFATGMAEPHVMASTTWGTAPTPPTPACTAPGTPQNLTNKSAKKALTLSWEAGTPAPNGGYRLYYVQSGKLQLVADVPVDTLSYRDSGLTSRMTYTYVVTAWEDCNSNGTFDVDVDLESLVSNQVDGTPR